MVRRFQQGDERAFDELVARWGPPILELARRLTGDPDAAQDVRQIALMRAYSALDGFHGRSRLSTWLYQVVLNLCRDHRRSETSRERATHAAGERVNGHAHPGPAGAALSREASDRVARAVAALPREEREVVVLRHYHDLPFPEIAEVLRAPVTTVKSRMTRGLGRLRETLKGMEP